MQERRAGAEGDRNECEDFFQNLSLKDIYGRKPRSIEISKTEYDLSFQNVEGKRAKSDYYYNNIIPLAQEHGIPNPEPSYVYPEGPGGNQEFHIVEKGVENKLASYWIPSHQEREIMLSLAKNLHEGEGTPNIVEIGSGSGILLNLLAFGNNYRGFGIDPLQDTEGIECRPIPTTPNVQMLRQDVWDALENFGPDFTSETRLERKKLLDFFKKETYEGSVFRDLADYGFQHGDQKKFNEELKKLQILSTQRTSESKVDLAVCSFMAQGKELTIPIRDGLLPKIIAYTMPMEGSAGAGDYYKYIEKYTPENYEAEFLAKNTLNEDSVISYNPGRNYTTVAMWYSPSYMIWETDYWKPEQFEPFSKYYEDPLKSSVRVVLQARNDQLPLTNLIPIETKRYPIDEEFDSYLNSPASGESSNVLREVRNSLFQTPTLQ